MFPECSVHEQRQDSSVPLYHAIVLAAALGVFCYLCFVVAYILCAAVEFVITFCFSPAVFGRFYNPDSYDYDYDSDDNNDDDDDDDDEEEDFSETEHEVTMDSTNDDSFIESDFEDGNERTIAEQLAIAYMPDDQDIKDFSPLPHFAPIVDISHISETPKTNCTYCWDNIEDDTPIRACSFCSKPSCHECFRRLFKLACQDEASMPPRCCGMPIPLAFGRIVLEPEEVDEYKARYDEWQTADRCYCPVSTCSAFLSPHLFPELRATQQAFVGQRMMHPGPAGSDSCFEIDCPRCSASICVKCVQLAHGERPCVRRDHVTPELADALADIGSKRCPRCRAAVRKTEGCNDMQCRCGASWCWCCARLLEQCEEEPCNGETGEIEEPEYNEDGSFSDEDEGPGDDGLEGIIDGDSEYLGRAMSDYDSDSDHDDEPEYDNTPDYENHFNYGSENDDDNDSATLSVKMQDKRIREVSAYAANWESDEEGYPVDPIPNNEHQPEENSAPNEIGEKLVVPFSCHHNWTPLQWFEAQLGLIYECEWCWGRVYPCAKGTKHLLTVSSDERDAFVNGLGEDVMVRCSVCYLLVCNKCRMASRASMVSMAPTASTAPNEGDWSDIN